MKKERMSSYGALLRNVFSRGRVELPLLLMTVREFFNGAAIPKTVAMQRQYLDGGS